jgi:phage baseplate assembly protein W
MELDMPIFSDIDINLERQVDGDIKVDKEIDAIKNSLSNIVSTIQGSRRMLPKFAMNAYQLLFEPIDEETGRSIGENILEVINEWDDRIQIEGLHVHADEDNNKYNCTLSFIILGRDKELQELDFILKQI